MSFYVYNCLGAFHHSRAGARGPSAAVFATRHQHAGNSVLEKRGNDPHEHL